MVNSFNTAPDTPDSFGGVSKVEDLLPIISFGTKKDGESEKKHGEFVERMVARGYTERQVRRLVDWYMRVKQAG